MFTGWDELKIDRKPWSLAGFLQISLKNLGYVSDMQEVNLTWKISFFEVWSWKMIS